MDIGRVFPLYLTSDYLELEGHTNIGGPRPNKKLYKRKTFTKPLKTVATDYRITNSQHYQMQTIYNNLA